MAWIEADFKGKTVWAEVGTDGKIRSDGGRVAIRYSKAAGAKVYRAGASRVVAQSDYPVELPGGVSADAAKAKKGASGFGSAGTRSPAQAAAAKASADDLLRSFSPKAARCYTDGACRGNPGPAGAGAVVELPGGEVIERYAALGTATNNVGELTAIGLALTALDEADFPEDAPVEVMTDSKYSYGVLVLGWKAKVNKELIMEVRGQIKARQKVRLHWIAGHVGIPGNERADALANKGVEESVR